MRVAIQLDLPESLIRRARKMGLLESQRIAGLLAEEVRPGGPSKNSFPRRVKIIWQAIASPL
jgi:hypothetical protein